MKNYVTFESAFTWFNVNAAKFLLENIQYHSDTHLKEHQNYINKKQFRKSKVCLREYNFKTAQNYSKWKKNGCATHKYALVGMKTTVTQTSQLIFLDPSCR